MPLIRNDLVDPQLDQAFDVAFAALKTLATSLDAIDIDVTPVIVVQPPSLRATRIRLLEASCSSLDDRSARLSALFGLISQAQRRLHHKRTRCRSALSPVAALPEEILRVIFPLTLDAVPSRQNNATRFTILAVCQDWRTAALGQQSLWSSSYVSNLRDERAFRMALRLNNGNNLKLTLDSVPRAFETHRLCQELFPHLEYLEWNTSYGLGQLFAAARLDGPPCFSALRTLIIDSPDYCASCMSLEGETQDLNDIHFPRLEVLELRHTELEEGLNIPTIRDLTLFQVSLTGRELENLLTGIPNVQRLYVSFAECFTTDASTSNLIRLRSLETLSLGWSLHDEARWFLDRVYAPNLLSFTLAEIEDVDEDDTGPRVSPYGIPVCNNTDVSLILSIAKLLTVSASVTALDLQLTAGAFLRLIETFSSRLTMSLSEGTGDRVCLQHLCNLKCVIQPDARIDAEEHEKQSMWLGRSLGAMMEARSLHDSEKGVRTLVVAPCVAAAISCHRPTVTNVECPCRHCFSNTR